VAKQTPLYAEAVAAEKPNKTHKDILALEHWAAMTLARAHELRLCGIKGAAKILEFEASVLTQPKEGE
jgi:hypothetical protein